MQDGHQTDVCVIDLSKAFDKVSPRCPVEKLEWYGIDGEVNTWTVNLLRDRTQFCL